MEAEQQENLTVMKLPVLPIKPNSHSHSMSSPIHSSIAASVPFSWEEEPGKPKQHSSSSSSSSTSSPLTSYSSSSPETLKSLELPPRLHSLEKDIGASLTKLNSPLTVFDGPYSMTRSRRLDSPSFRMMVKGSGDCYGLSFRSDMYGDLDDVDEETKQENMSSNSSALVKKRRGLGFFGFSRRRALKRKTEFGRGSYVFPSSVDRESECGRKEVQEEDKRFGYRDGDGITCSQSSRFCEVNITNISRRGSFSTLPTPPSSSKSHFWTNVYAGLKQVVPWKNKKTSG